MTAAGDSAAREPRCTCGHPQGQHGGGFNEAYCYDDLCDCIAYEPTLAATRDVRKGADDGTGS